MMTNTFWALIGLILFLLVLIYYRVPHLLKASLDKRANQIKKELDDARRLREEAQQLLAEYQKKRSQAEQEADEIIASAKRQAEGIIVDMRKETEDYIARRNKTAEQRIALAEKEAVQLIKSTAVEKAVNAATLAMQDRVKEDDSESERLFKKSISDVKDNLHNIG